MIGRECDVYTTTWPCLPNAGARHNRWVGYILDSWSCTSFRPHMNGELKRATSVFWWSMKLGAAMGEGAKLSARRFAPFAIAKVSENPLQSINILFVCSVGPDSSNITSPSVSANRMPCASLDAQYHPITSRDPTTVSKPCLSRSFNLSRSIWRAVCFVLPPSAHLRSTCVERTRRDELQGQLLPLAHSSICHTRHTSH